MPPRPTLEAMDLVTPASFGAQVGVKAGTVRVWIARSPSIIGRRVEPLGHLGPYETYDWNDLAELEREMHRRQIERAAAQGARAA